MKINCNSIIDGKHGKPILYDSYLHANADRKPVIVFIHGFKGFKDWGTFHLLGLAFAKAGFVFIKFNLSHNGSTPDQPEELTDLEAFGNNNFSIELDDLGCVIEHITNAPQALKQNVDASKIFLVGHSRGGGLAILKAAEDKRVKKIATWASVIEFGRFWDKHTMDTWQKKGVHHVLNSRTGQQLPLYYQLYEDYFANQERLYIPDAVRQLTIPTLIVHGTNDETVPFAWAKEMHGWNENSTLLPIEGTGHTFGGRHPWNEPALPASLQEVVDATCRFFHDQ